MAQKFVVSTLSPVVISTTPVTRKHFESFCRFQEADVKIDRGLGIMAVASGCALLSLFLARKEPKKSFIKKGAFFLSAAIFGEGLVQTLNGINDKTNSGLVRMGRFSH